MPPEIGSSPHSPTDPASPAAAPKVSAAPAKPGRPPDAEEVRSFLWRGLTLEERRRTLGSRDAASARAPLPSAPPQAVRNRLQLWSKALAPGNEEAFRRRLSWDRWNETELLTVLSDAPPKEPPAEPFVPLLWEPVLEEVEPYRQEVAEELEAGGVPEEAFFEAGKGAPFLELWVPFLRFARTRVSASAGTAWKHIRPEAARALERRLLLDLSGLGVESLFEAFGKFRRSAGLPREGSGKRSRYRAFVKQMTTSPVHGIWGDFGFLARQVCLTTLDWVESTGELLSRLEEDHEALAGLFGGGQPLGRVSSFEPALSDRHFGGRQVVAVHFESGCRVIYKPRPVDLEAAFHGFLAWLGAEGLEDAPPALCFLPRGPYGWVEFAEGPLSLSSRAAAERYFRKAGGLLLIAEVLRLDDLHSENLVSTEKGPVLVDCEMALQPLLPTNTPGQSRRRRTLLSSQLLTSFQIDAEGRPYESGALRAVGGQVREKARRTWRNVNTDAMSFQLSRSRSEPPSGAVWQGERSVLPEEHPGAVVAGFRETYRFLLRMRPRILAADGPLTKFRGCKTRILFRPTDVYSVLLARLAAPPYLRSGAAASLLVDSLNRVFAEETQRPPLWPLARHEARALLRRDVPCFRVGTEAEALEDPEGGAPVGPPFEASGLEAVRQRVEALEEDDLDSQLQLLQKVLTHPPRFVVPQAALHSGGRSEGAPGRDELLRQAEAIGVRLRQRREELSGDGQSDTSWLMPAGSAAPLSHHLYDGSCGVAVFLAALGARLGDETYRIDALEALEPLREALGAPARDALKGCGPLEDCSPLEDYGLGAGHGLGGVVYGLVLLSSFLDEPLCLDWARQAAQRITTERIAADRRLDVEGGAAGAILGLLALHRATGDEKTLATALECGEHLLAQAPPGGQGDPRAVPAGLAVGLAHGASGFALALARLGAAAQRQELLEIARDLFAEERRKLVSDATGLGGSLDGRWCNGTAGMALARLGTRHAFAEAWPEKPPNDLENDLEVILQGAISRLAARGDDLCCGRMGRSGAILEAGLRLDDPWLRRTAGVAAGAVLADARRSGGFRLGSGGATDQTQPHPSQQYQPQLFSGLSGIGYQLLCLADPEALPSLLLFEARGPAFQDDGGLAP